MSSRADQRAGCYALKRNATKLILGNPAGRQFIPFKPRLQERIARANPEVGLIILSVEAVPKTHKSTVIDEPQGYARALLIATLACGVTTTAAAWLLRVFDLSNIVMLFLMTVVFVAMRLGRLAGAWAAGAWAALLCVACFLLRRATPLVHGFDKPEAPLTVDPVTVLADIAVAGWAQGDMGGRALLRKKHGSWSLDLCGGDALKDAAALQQSGLPPNRQEA